MAQERKTLPVHSRIAGTTRRVTGRFARPPSPYAPPLWTRDMVVFVVVMLAAALASAVYADVAVMKFVEASQNPVLLFLRRVTDSVKSHYYLIPAFAIMTLVSVLDWKEFTSGAKKKGIRAYERAAFIFFAIALPGIFVNIVKQIVGRGRPRTFEEAGGFVFEPFRFEHTFQSFPSGHSATAGSIAMVLALWFPRWRWVFWIAGFILAFARVPARAHFLSDVIVGFAIGMIMTLLLARHLARRSSVFRLSHGQSLPSLKA